ncbi:MAG: ACT domain-containing protein [Actinobacteria bacterium]|nr:ACT domain-containing protein [Actinomycetota bacterium]
MTVVEYLGPEGTFAHAATDLLRTVGHDGPAPSVDLVPRATVAEIIHDVDDGRCDHGLVPIENSVDGGVTGTIDVLVFETERVRLREEVVVPVSFGAHRRAEFADQPMTTVLSHPVGLAQCRRFAARHGLDVRSTDSTAEACRAVAASADPGLVAVASAKAAALAGLVTVEHGVEDHPGASTRFALVSCAGVGPTGDDKTTIVVIPPSEGVGVLLGILQPISEAGVNISNITSRPLRPRLGEYCFVLTLDRHETDPGVVEALARLRGSGCTVRPLGSYPAWRGER